MSFWNEFNNCLCCILLKHSKFSLAIMVTSTLKKGFSLRCLIHAVVCLFIWACCISSESAKRIRRHLFVWKCLCIFFVSLKIKDFESKIRDLKKNQFFKFKNILFHLALKIHIAPRNSWFHKIKKINLCQIDFKLY